MGIMEPGQTCNNDIFVVLCQMLGLERPYKSEAETPFTNTLESWGVLKEGDRIEVNRYRRSVHRKWHPVIYKGECISHHWIKVAYEDAPDETYNVNLDCVRIPTPPRVPAWGRVRETTSDDS